MMAKKCDVLVLGAGASGLMASALLSRTGKSVTILEARNRIGGRIHTITSAGSHAELGAEFIHGDLPLTLKLLNQAGIAYHTISGNMLQHKDGAFINNSQPIEHWDLLMSELKKLSADISIGDLLEKRFKGKKYDALKTSVYRYVAGYDSADPDIASALALKKEWESEDEDAQHRIDNGYGKLIHHLAEECKHHKAIVHNNTIAKKIEWKPGKVTVTVANGKVYTADKLIIAMPLGVLQADAKEEGGISFYPPITQHQQALQQLGFGSVIKVLLEFDTPFWKDEARARSLGYDPQNIGFILSNEEIPTWWMQQLKNSAILTGWIGGPFAELKKYDTEDELLSQSIQAISNIFNMPVVQLRQQLVSWFIVNWITDPFTLGAYAYDTVDSPAGRKVLTVPVDDTIYFAGEYLYDGPAMGTVEAALSSGKKVAENIMASSSSPL